MIFSRLVGEFCACAGKHHETLLEEAKLEAKEAMEAQVPLAGAIACVACVACERGDLGDFGMLDAFDVLEHVSCVACAELCGGGDLGVLDAAQSRDGGRRRWLVALAICKRCGVLGMCGMAASLLHFSCIRLGGL